MVDDQLAQVRKEKSEAFKRTQVEKSDDDDDEDDDDEDENEDDFIDDEAEEAGSEEDEAEAQRDRDFEHEQEYELERASKQKSTQSEQVITEYPPPTYAEATHQVPVSIKQQLKQLKQQKLVLKQRKLQQKLLLKQQKQKQQEEALAYEAAARQDIAREEIYIDNEEERVIGSFMGAAAALLRDVMSTGRGIGRDSARLFQESGALAVFRRKQQLKTKKSTVSRTCRMAMADAARARYGHDFF